MDFCLDNTLLSSSLKIWISYSFQQKHTYKSRSQHFFHQNHLLVDVRREVQSSSSGPACDELASFVGACGFCHQSSFIHIPALLVLGCPCSEWHHSTRMLDSACKSQDQPVKLWNSINMASHPVGRRCVRVHKRSLSAYIFSWNNKNNSTRNGWLNSWSVALLL